MVVRERLLIGSCLLAWTLASACDGDSGGTPDSGGGGGDASADDASGSDDAAGQDAVVASGWWSFVGGDAVTRQVMGGTFAVPIPCGDSVFVSHFTNTGYASSWVLARSVAGGAFTAHEVLVSGYPSYVCGPRATLYGVGESHIVTGTYSNPVHHFAYQAASLDGETVTDLGVVTSGNEGLSQTRLLSDGVDVYFAAQASDGFRVWVHTPAGGSSGAADAWTPLPGADPYPDPAFRVSVREDDYFADERAAYVTLTDGQGDGGAVRILALADRAFTTRYEGVVDFGFDRRWLAHEGRLFAYRINSEDGVSGLVEVDGDAVLVTFSRPFELSNVDRVPGGFIGMVFRENAPDWMPASVVRIDLDGTVTQLGIALADGVDPVWSEFRSQYRRLGFFEAGGVPHTLVDWIVAAGGAGWSDLAVLKHDGAGRDR